METINRKEFAELVKDMKPRLKRGLRFVPEEISNWQDRDFLAVMDRNKSEGVLIFQNHVVPFHLQKRGANTAGRIEVIICDFCATWQRGSNSAIISFPKKNSMVSFLCCGDLDCSLHVRDKTNEAKISRTQLRENNIAEQRIQRLQVKLNTVLNDLSTSS